VPQKDSPDLSSYKDKFLGVLEDHYGKELAAKSVEGEEFTVPAKVSSVIRTEWMTFRRYHTTRLKERHRKIADGISYQQHASTDISPSQWPWQDVPFDSCWYSIIGTKLLPNEDDQSKAKESS